MDIILNDIITDIGSNIQFIIVYNLILVREESLQSLAVYAIWLTTHSLVCSTSQHIGGHILYNTIHVLMLLRTTVCTPDYGGYRSRSRFHTVHCYSFQCVPSWVNWICLLLKIKLAYWNLSTIIACIMYSNHVLLYLNLPAKYYNLFIFYSKAFHFLAFCIDIFAPNIRIAWFLIPPTLWYDATVITKEIWVASLSVPHVNQNDLLCIYRA